MGSRPEILIRKVEGRRRRNYKIWLRETFLVPRTPTSLQTILAAEAYLAFTK
jgi:hypothetical protein